MGESSEPWGRLLLGRLLFHATDPLTTPFSCRVHDRSTRKDQIQSRAESGRLQDFRFMMSLTVCMLGNTLDTLSPMRVFPSRY